MRIELVLKLDYLLIAKAQEEQSTHKRNKREQASIALGIHSRMQYYACTG